MKIYPAIDYLINTIDAVIYKPFQLEDLFKTIETLYSDHYENALSEQMAVV